MKNVMLFIVAFLISGCGSEFEVIKDYDESSGKMTYKMSGNLIEAKDEAKLFSDKKIELNAIKIQRGRENQYFIQLILKSSVWYFIKDGRSITFFIDGEIYTLNTNKENMYSDVYPGGQNSPLPSMVEKVFYEADLNLFSKIVSADQVKVKINTQKGYIERELKKENKENFKTFLALIGK